MHRTTRDLVGSTAELDGALSERTDCALRESDAARVHHGASTALHHDQARPRSGHRVGAASLSWLLASGRAE